MGSKPKGPRIETWLRYACAAAALLAARLWSRAPAGLSLAPTPLLRRAGSLAEWRSGQRVGLITQRSQDRNLESLKSRQNCRRRVSAGMHSDAQGCGLDPIQPRVRSLMDKASVSGSASPITSHAALAQMVRMAVSPCSPGFDSRTGNAPLIGLDPLPARFYLTGLLGDHDFI